jgi:hypothetical protein
VKPPSTAWVLATKWHRQTVRDAKDRTSTYRYQVEPLIIEIAVQRKMAPVKGPSVLHLFVHRLLHIVMMVVMLGMLVLHSLGVRGRDRQSEGDSGQCGQNESNLLHVSVPQVRRSKVALKLTKTLSGVQGQHYEWTFRLQDRSSVIALSSLSRGKVMRFASAQPVLRAR